MNIIKPLVATTGVKLQRNEAEVAFVKRIIQTMHDMLPPSGESSELWDSLGPYAQDFYNECIKAMKEGRELPTLIEANTHYNKLREAEEKKRRKLKQTVAEANSESCPVSNCAVGSYYTILTNGVEKFVNCIRHCEDKTVIFRDSLGNTYTKFPYEKAYIFHQAKKPRTFVTNKRKHPDEYLERPSPTMFIVRAIVNEPNITKDEVFTLLVSNGYHNFRKASMLHVFERTKAFFNEFVKVWDLVRKTPVKT